jgi:hypothetical protein
MHADLHKVCRLWHKVLKLRRDKHRLPRERMDARLPGIFPQPASVNHILRSAYASLPEEEPYEVIPHVQIWRGCRVTGIPTATATLLIARQLSYLRAPQCCRSGRQPRRLPLRHNPTKPPIPPSGCEIRR